jgi:DNA-binding transcriptional regulator YdaS (Cro superfamily)
MELKDWIGLGYGRGKALARFVKRSPSFVSNMARGERQIPIVMMSAIEAFTRKQVTRQEMLPDGWRQQWPELCSDKPEDIWPELAALMPAQALQFGTGTDQHGAQPSAAGQGAQLGAAEDWGTVFDCPAITAGLVPEPQPGAAGQGV